MPVVLGIRAVPTWRCPQVSQRSAESGTWLPQR